MPTNIGFTPASYSGSLSSSGQYVSGSGPAYDRVTSIPGWLPRERAGELEDQYRRTNEMFDTDPFRRASETQQTRVLTTAMNAGNNAAAEYANRSRQAGGNALGAGLMKAQAQVGARSEAGKLDMEKEKFIAQQREAAATHATSIAKTLGELRSNYLNSIVNYATASDRTNADYASRNRELALEEAKFGADESRRQSSSYSTDRFGRVTSLAGTGLNNNPNFNANTGILSNAGFFGPYG